MVRNMRNTVSSLIMLSAGMVAILCCIFMGYTLETTLIALVTVLFVFMIIGFIAQKIISDMTKEAEERFQQEEAKRREEEAAEAARLEEEAARAEEEAARIASGEIFEPTSPDEYEGDGMFSMETIE